MDDPGTSKTPNEQSSRNLNTGSDNDRVNDRKETETGEASAMPSDSQGWRLKDTNKEHFLKQEMTKDAFDDMKLRECIRDSEEIMELERKLRSAYIQRDIAAQRVEKKAQRLKEECRKKQEQKLFREYEKQNEELNNLLKKHHLNKQVQYNEDLREQLTVRRQIKDMEYKKKLEEQALIENSLKTLLEEDKKDRELMLFKKQKAKEDTLSMLEAKREIIELEKRQEEEEERKRVGYQSEKIRQEMRIREEHRRKVESLRTQRDACAGKLVHADEERKERERILQILLEEETRLKEEEKITKGNQDRLRKNLEYKEINAQQIARRMQTLEEDKRNELILCQKLLEENEKAMRLEEEEVTKKKMENLKHGQELKRLIEEQNFKRIREVEARYVEELRDIEARRERQRLLAEERIRILRRHAKDLIGFLPKGVLSEADLQQLDPQVQQFYTRSHSLQTDFQ